MAARRPSTVAVVGLGLIGGSLALALKARGWRVLGVDRTETRRRARAAGAVDAAAARVEDVIEEADVLVLAAPPRANLRLLRRVARAARSNRLVITDVGSVKGPICAEARRLGLDRFVGGHPVAGNEGSGFAAARADVFAGRAWALVPGTDRRAFALARRLVRATGARAVSVKAAEHDRALAFLSHAPQVVAWALAAAASGDGTARRLLGLAGPGFRDMTRLARSPRALWREILAENRAEVGRALASVSRRLTPGTGGR